MRKLTYEEKPRLTLRKVKDGYTLTFIASSGRVWRGCGITPLSAWHALEFLIEEFQISLQKQHNRAWYGDGRYVGNKNGPDVIFEPSDTIYKATSNLPWWKRLFRV